MNRPNAVGDAETSRKPCQSKHAARVDQQNRIGIGIQVLVQRERILNVSRERIHSVEATAAGVVVAGAEVLQARLVGLLAAVEEARGCVGGGSEARAFELIPVGIVRVALQDRGGRGQESPCRAVTVVEKELLAICRIPLRNDVVANRIAPLEHAAGVLFLQHLRVARVVLWIDEIARGHDRTRADLLGLLDADAVRVVAVDVDGGRVVFDDRRLCEPALAVVGERMRFADASAPRFLRAAADDFAGLRRAVVGVDRVRVVRRANQHILRIAFEAVVRLVGVGRRFVGREAARQSIAVVLRELHAVRGQVVAILRDEVVCRPERRIVVLFREPTQLVVEPVDRGRVAEVVGRSCPTVWGWRLDSRGGFCRNCVPLEHFLKTRFSGTKITFIVPGGLDHSLQNEALTRDAGDKTPRIRAHSESYKTPTKLGAAGRLSRHAPRAIGAKAPT